MAIADASWAPQTKESPYLSTDTIQPPCAQRLRKPASRRRNEAEHEPLVQFASILILQSTQPATSRSRAGLFRMINVEPFSSTISFFLNSDRVRDIDSRLVPMS